MRKKLAEFNIACNVTKVVVCYLLNKCIATFTIVAFCQQIAKHSAPVIPQSICGRIPHSIFRILQSIFTVVDHVHGSRSRSVHDHFGTGVNDFATVQFCYTRYLPIQPLLLQYNSVDDFGAVLQMSGLYSFNHFQQ